MNQENKALIVDVYLNNVNQLQDFVAFISNLVNNRFFESPRLGIMKIISSFVLATSFVIFALSAHAENFYKWTDEDGVVHYSQRAPAGKEAQTISTKTAPSSDQQQDNTEASADSGSEENDTPEEETAQQAPTPEVVKKDPETCKKAQKDLQVLKSRPIVRQNGKVMTVDEKNKQIQTLNEIIAVHC